MINLETIEEDREVKDRHFDGWRAPRTDKARELVADVVTNLQNYEQHREPRQRRRRATDQNTFETTVAAVVCDLVYSHLRAPGVGVAVSRSKSHLGRKSRYRPPSENEMLPGILDKMAKPEMAFLVQAKSSAGQPGLYRRTTIKAGKRLLDRIEWLDENAGAIHHHLSSHVFWLLAGGTSRHC